MSDLSGQQIVFVPSLGDPANPGQPQVTRQNFVATTFTDGGGFKEPVYSGGGFSEARDPVVTEDVTSGPSTFTLTGDSSSPGTAAYEVRSNFYVFQLPASTNFVFTSANITFASDYAGDYTGVDPTSHFSFDGDHIYLGIGGKELARSSFVIHFTVQPLNIASTATGVSDIYRAGGAGVIIDGGVTAAYNGGGLTDATIQIGAGFVSGDSLNFTNQNGITGAYDAIRGVLTLTGLATANTYQTALDSVTFSTSASTFGGVRTVSFSVSDGGGTSSATSGHSSTTTSDTVLVIGPPTATGTGGAAGTGALHGASAPGGGTLSITSVTGASAAQPVAAGSTSTSNPTTVTGSYGELTIGADGSYSYSADNGLAIVSHPDGSPIVDTYADVVTASSGGSRASSVAVTVSLAAGGVERVINPTGSATYTIGATTLILDETAADSFSGVIQDGSSGNHGGAVVVTGGSPLTLSGASTYTGGTTLSAGAGPVTAANASALSTGAVTDNAALAFVGVDGAVANAISGSGSLTVSGVRAGNTLTFSGGLSQAGGFAVADASNVAIAASGGYAAAHSIQTHGGDFTLAGVVTTSAGADGLQAVVGGVVTVGGPANSTAQIVGGDTGVSAPGGSAALAVNNYGLIEGQSYEGITYRATGVLTLTNFGTGVLYGAGSSESTAWAVGDDQNNAGRLNVSNASGGKLIGAGFGVYGTNVGDNVSNSGLIGVGSYSGGAYTRSSAAAAPFAISGAGVYLVAGGSVVNAATGLISGSSNTAYQAYNFAAGVVATGGGALTVDNGGTITGGVLGVAQSGFGTLTVVNRAGATISATTNDAIYTEGVSGSIINAGTLTGGNAGVFVLGANLTLINTGMITQVGGLADTVTSGVYDYGDGATITNSGIIRSTVTGGSGVQLGGANETVINQAGGMIGGGSGGGLGLSLTGAGNAVTLKAGSTVSGGIAATATTGVDVLNVYNGQGTKNGGTQAAASFGAVTLAAATDTINLRGAGDGSAANGAAGTLDLGAITAPNGFALNQVDAGLWTLTGFGTSTGATTVSAGVLAVDATAYASAITVAGGTLRGTANSEAAVTVQSSATFAPGETGAGAFTTTGALALNAGAALSITASSTANYTHVTAASATLGGALNFTYTGGAEAYGTSYDIVHLTGAAPATGTFSNYAQGATFVSGGETFQVSYMGGASGYDVVLTDVPAYAPSPPVTPGETASQQLGFAVEFDNLARARATDAAFSNLDSPLYAQAQAEAQIAASLDAGRIGAADAQSALLHLLDGTTSVAEITYAFFTGKTPTATGLNYLVHSPANPTDLNDAYYIRLSAENRYINFAVNLATGSGAGAAPFQAAYGAMSLNDATAKAYEAVFGIAPSIGKIDAILNGEVSDGVGGTETRAQYFADITDGSAAAQKAAVIGFLLADSVKEGFGTYQQADLHFLQDLAHGTAAFNVDLLTTYGPTPTLIGQPVGDPTLGG